ncbi:hypothetical protein V8C42DRAFT_359555 [Trichoderma barbatum]
MDHLPLPINKLAHAPLEVPYLCDDEFRRNDQFRNANQYFCDDDDSFLVHMHRACLELVRIIHVGHADINNVAPVLQERLWFDLLGQILGIGARAHVKQHTANFDPFVAQNIEGSSVISTTSLVRYIKEVGWINDLLLPDGIYRQKYYDCLRLATVTTNTILSSEMCREHLRSGCQFTCLPVLFRVILSIQILVESFLAAESVLLPWEGNLPLRLTMSYYDYQVVDLLLIEAGWCKYEIKKLPGSIRLRYYLSFIYPSNFAQGNGDHLSCTGDACAHTPQSMDEQTIEPSHVSKDCKCSMETIQDLSVTNLIKAGLDPLLRFTQKDGASRKLELLGTMLDINATNQFPFVAISHDRHAALGNSTAHSLPYCQLARIQSLIDGIPPASAVTSSTPFWLDTMCMPLDRRDHATSIKLVREIFKHASRVLVIDQTLCSHTIGSFEEALIQIRYSLWKRQLWTLQEGFAISASKLIFSFANGLLSLRYLLERYGDKAIVPFPLLQCKRFVGFRVLPYLKQTLNMLDDDINALAEISPRGHLEKSKLQRILRLGYLASDDFKYFREDLETQQIQKLLQLLGNLYLDSQSSPIVPGSRSADQVVSCLESLYKLDI